VLVGLHDWLGFTQSLDGWSIVDSMTFRLTFTTYYEAALRELAYIRPFRMISVATLPSMAAGYVSHIKFRQGSPRTFCNGPSATEVNRTCYIMGGVSAPIGTGPYMVVDKLLVTASGSSRRLPAADFNATCYMNDVCPPTPHRPLTHTPAHAHPHAAVRRRSPTRCAALDGRRARTTPASGSRRCCSRSTLVIGRTRRTTT
jgi:hypothetical protein